jgi:hypothetical protein
VIPDDLVDVADRRHTGAEIDAWRVPASNAAMAARFMKARFCRATGLTWGMSCSTCLPNSRSTAQL